MAHHDEVDIVRDIIDRLCHEVPDIAVDVVWRIEQEIRHEHGGRRVYIRSHARASGRGSQIARCLSAGATVAELSEAMGVSRQTIYNLIKQRKTNGRDHS